MTRDKLIELVLNRCGRRAGQTDFDSYAQTEIIELQNRFEAGLELDSTGGVFWPWFLLAENATAQTTSGEERLPTPNGFLCEFEDGALWVKNGDGDWDALHRDEYDVLIDEYPGSGRPEAYALTDGYWRLFPTPDDAYDMRVLVYKADAELSSNIENAWLKHASGLFIAGLGKVIAGYYLYNWNLAQAFERDEMRERTRLHSSTVARTMGNFELQLGGK